MSRERESKKCSEIANENAGAELRREGNMPPLRSLSNGFSLRISLFE